ncbi:MAG: hypothetical protein SFW65_02060 [Alphaproteobacteria bacterium]|nr:hypothetical protein [Alphaproteobacteria bacterium]
MKKLILSALFALFTTFAVQASASAVTDSVQAAIAAGNFEKINQIAAANPGAQGEIALYLLQQAQSKIATNPTLAAKLFTAAGPFVGQIPESQSKQAATIIAALVNIANGKGFQAASPCPASDIFAAALGMTEQTNISTQNAGLHGQTVSNANGLMAQNPQCEGDKLAALLAVTQGTTPTVNTLGAHAPSVE